MPLPERATTGRRSTNAAAALQDAWRSLCERRQAQLIDPEDADKALDAARWNERRGDATAASRLYLRAATLAPRRMEPYLALTRLLCAHELHVEAAEFLREAIERVPDRAELWCALAQVRWELRDRDNAETFVEEALRIAPGYSPARVLLSALSADPGEIVSPVLSEPDRPADSAHAIQKEIRAALAENSDQGLERIIDLVTAHYLGLASFHGIRDLPPPDLARRASPDSGADLLVELSRIAAEHGDLGCASELLLAAGSPAADSEARARLHDPNMVLESAALNADTMFAFYDLEKGPLTYDFTHYLALAEKFRAASGRSRLCVVFVPGRRSGFRDESPRDRFMSEIRKEWRLNHVLIASCHLVPSGVGAIRLRSREEASALAARLAPDSVFPFGYNANEPICPYALPVLLQFVGSGPDVRSFRAPAMSAALVRQWLRDRAGDARVVSITLRNNDFQPQRNSRIEAWLRAAEFCRAKGLFPVFVPDTEALLRGPIAPFEGFPTLPLAALSVSFRAALYEESWLNLMTSNGPYALALYNARARFSMFKLVVPDVPTATERFLRAQGIVPGEQLPFAGPEQRFVWHDDEFDAIAREVGRALST